MDSLHKKLSLTVWVGKKSSVKNACKSVFAGFLQKTVKSGDVDVIENGCHHGDAGMAVRCVECLDQKASDIRLDRQQSQSLSWEKQGLSLGC